MDQEALVNEQIEAGRELLTRFEKQFPVKAAVWVKNSNDGKWRFYIVLDQPNTGRVSINHLGNVWAELRSPYLNISRLSLREPDDPIAQDAAGLFMLYSSDRGFWYEGSTFGGIPSERAYLYPTSVAIP
jgi:hypothetical protein